MATKTQKSYRRGGSELYAKLAKKSQEARISRHIEAEIYLDPKRVTKIPFRKRETDLGYDVAACQKISVYPGEMKLIPTGIHIKVPAGYAFQFAGRSSLNAKGLRVVPDIVDATYTGELFVRVQNESSKVIAIDVGDRIAQLVFLPQIHVKFKPVESFMFEDGERGRQGLGSSGLK